MRKIISLLLCVICLFSFYCINADAKVVKMLPTTAFAVNVGNKNYNGKAIKPKVTSRISSKEYVVKYKNNKNVGTATIFIKGKNHYIGTIKKKFRILPKRLKSKDFKLNKNSFSYTGKAIKPKIKTKINKKYFTVSYLNNNKKGTAFVIIKGKGNYTGTIKKTFKIKSNSSSNNTGASNNQNTSNILDKTYKLKESYFKFDLSDKTYTGKPIQPTVTTDLAKKYYSIEYENNVDVGTATIIITGNLNYTGTIKKTFKIVPCIINNDLFRVDTSDKFYSNSKIMPNVSSRLIVDDDYSIEYLNNVNVGTATIIITGKGNYTGTVSFNFNIVAKPINKGMFEINLDTVTYNGKAQEKAIDTVLKYNDDYTVQYLNNVDVGTATIIITGKGNYTGELQYGFRINPLEINASWFQVDTSNKVYTAKPIELYVWTYYVPVNQYEVTYSNNTNIGTATIKIRGIGNYTGTVSFNFNIVAPTVNKVASLTLTVSGTKIKNKWSSVSNITGYEVWRKKSGEDFKKVKTLSDTSYTTVSLSAGTYYVKVRAYKKIGTQTFYGAFSSSSKITIK